MHYEESGKEIVHLMEHGKSQLHYVLDLCNVHIGLKIYPSAVFIMFSYFDIDIYKYIMQYVSQNSIQLNVAYCHTFVQY